MNFEDCRAKYFIIVEGEERAIIRNTAADAERKRKRLSKYNKGKKIYVFRADQRNEG